MSKPQVAARLFVALPMPSPVRRLLARIQPAAAEGVRPVAPADLHITLHFLGRAELLPVRRALEAVGASPFPIRLARPDHFSLRGGRKILWIGVEPDEPLVALHAKTGAALAAVGFEPETRRFEPHVTLARITPKAPAAAVRSVDASSLPRGGVAFECREFALYSSRTLPEGARYEVIQAYPLASDPAADA